MQTSRVLIFLIAYSFFSQSLLSQQFIKPLTIGDHAPDLKFENVLNYRSNKAKLSDFKDKLVILDMWSTWCTACIASFPRMEKLQNQFKDKIQILLVNHYKQLDPEDRIRKLLQKQKERTGFYTSLPIPIHDTNLAVLFPHQSVPHEVWIDGNGKIVAITGANEVNEINIKTFLEGKAMSLPVKNDWAFDKEKPFLVDGNGGSSDDFLYRSIFTKYKGGLSKYSGPRLNDENEVIGLYYINKSLFGFAKEAYSDLFTNLPTNRVVVNVKNPENFKDESNSQNLYCYDLTIPPIKWNLWDAKKYLREDLERYFNISVHREKRTSGSFVINTRFPFQNTKYNKPEFDLENASIKKYIHNYSISDVVKLLDRFNIPMVYEAETLSQKIDIDFPDHFDLTNQQAVIDFLIKAGFHIKQEERELEVVVITDKK